MSRLVASQRAWLAPSWVREELSRKAQALPSLDLRFAESKSLTDAASGQSLVTFTRASSGTYVGSDGLLKTATTNIIWPSEDFTTSWGIASATRVADAGVAPNGTLTADRIESTGGGVFRSGVSVVSGVPYTYSVYIKHVSGTGVISSIGFERFGSVPLAAQTSFNVLTGTVVSNGAAVTASSITPVGDGWYRVSIRATSTDTTTTVTNYTSTSGNQFLLWGAQLEQSSTVGEYIPTTSTINSAPRFDHNPTTGESLGLLVEEQRTNLLLQSENFGTTWTSSGLLAFGSGSTLNAASAPDGQTTADLITEDTTTTTHVSTQGNISFTSGTIYTVSCFVKRGTGSRNAAIALRAAAFSGAPRVNIDLSTGATTLTGSGGTVGSLSYLNGWWRVSLTATATATVTSFVDIGLVSGAATLSYTGDGTSGIYVWGAQLEAGSFPTSYIPTTTATATRSADVASITGTNFSSWYRQETGTFFADAILPYTVPGTQFPILASANDGTTSNRVDIGYLTSNVVALEVATGGVTQATLYPSISTAITSRRIAGAYASNDFAVAANTTTFFVDTGGTVPTVTQLRIGDRTGASNNYSNGTIRRLTFWPARLPNSTLQQITQ